MFAVGLHRCKALHARPTTQVVADYAFACLQAFTAALSAYTVSDCLCATVLSVTVFFAGHQVQL